MKRTMPRMLSAHICLAAVGSVVATVPVFGGASAPPSPDKPWYPPQLHEYEKKLAHREVGERPSGTPIAIDPEKVYDLPELIDIAERTNPETRIAWERARQAAAAVGYEHAFVPFPTLKQGPGPSDVSVTGGGTLATDAVGERAALGVKWLLFDFGERKAVATMAKEGLMAANVGFNAVHQQIVFTVTRRFYELNTAQQKVAVTEISVRAADTVAQAARARLGNGLATKPDLLQAEHQSAQAAFELEAARGALSAWEFCPRRNFA